MKVSIWLKILLILAMALFGVKAGRAQDSASADVGIYQLGVVAEARPGTEISYLITVTNRGPKAVTQFYILDGWTINSAGIAGFAAPVADPAFEKFSLAGKWQQTTADQQIVAWLLNGDLKPGDTAKFVWKVRVNGNYRGALVNWAGIQIQGELKGKWSPAASQQTEAQPPALASEPDPEQTDNRTADGITLVTDTPGGKGIDLAVFQTGLLSKAAAGQPLTSTLMITNRGPEATNQFYLMLAWSLGADGTSVLAQPAPEPDFAGFKVLGRWQQQRIDEEVWLWLLDGGLPAGSSAEFTWTRALNPAYRGDMVNWAKVLTAAPPDGTWIAREGTTTNPVPITNPPDVAPDNNRSEDAVTTISD